MKKIMSSILAAVLIMAFIFSGNVFAATEDVKSADLVGVSYRTHVQNIGWETTWAADGLKAGTEGRGLRLEGIQIKLTGDALPENGGIEYRTHVENVGWETKWAANGESSGTEGRGLRLEGIQIRLVNLPSNYSVQYRTHVQNVGWETKWAVNGETAGTEGKGLRLEGIEIKIIKNGSNLTAYNSALEAVKQADFTPASWTAYQAVVAANVVTAEDLQTKVDGATAAIISAQAKLVKAPDLTAFYAAVAAVGQNDYTTASWNVYQTVLAANAVTINDSQLKVDAATAAITAAQANLVKLANMTAYDAAFNGIKQEQVKSGWAAYKAVLDASIVTNQNTQVQVDAATAAILTAQTKLVLYADLTAFNKAIALYLQYGSDSSNAPYSTATWNAYVERCELYGTLTNEKWVYDVVSQNSTQSTVNAATNYINAAIANLEKAADLTAFNAAKAIAITDGPYTTDSFNAYTTDLRVTAITEIPLAALKGYSQGVVDAYTTTLLALQKEILVAGSDLTAYNEIINRVKQQEFTTVSWTAYQAVVAANPVTTDNTQAQVDAAVLTITAAQKNLVYSAAYVVVNGIIDSAHFEVQGVGDNILTRAKELLNQSGFNEAKYSVSFSRIDTGTAGINPTTGEITAIGNGSATITVTITPIDGSAAATTENVVLVLN